MPPDDSTPVTPNPPAPPASPTPPTQGPPTEDPVWLADRLARAERASLKKHFGSDDPAALKARLDRAEELEKAEKERARLALSEQQRLQQDLDTERAKATDAQRERDAIAFESRVVRVCAELGVKNVDFAMFEIARAAEALPEGQTLDPTKYLQELAAKGDSQKMALGMSSAPGVIQVPATTTPNPGDPPAAPGGIVPGEKTAFEMDDKAWAAKKASLGIG